MAVSKRLRYEVLRRDNHQCRYCGAGAPDARLTVDHVLPTALGGSDEPSNLVAACGDCNAGKSASSPDAALVEDVSQDQVRWGRAMAVAVEQRAAELAAERTRLAQFDDAWLSWSYSGDVKIMRPGDWKSSVLRFMAAGIDDEFLADAIETAAGNPKLRNKDVWRYFCGICWREIDRLQALASQQVADMPALRVTPDPSPHLLFPYPHLAESFIAELLEVFDGTEWVPLITRTYWSALQEAYEEFVKGPGIWDSEEDRAQETFDSCTAPTLFTIKQARDGGRVPNGS